MTKSTDMTVYGTDLSFVAVQIRSDAGDFSIRVDDTSDNEFADTDHEIVIYLSDDLQDAMIRVVTPDGHTHRIEGR